MKSLLGFTLIELVIVIILIAILSAVALPRFMGITESAHDANVQGIEGALSSSISWAHAKWLATGQPTVSAPLAGLDLTQSGYADTGFSEQGWPNSATDGTRDIQMQDVLGHAPNNAAICVQLVKNLLVTQRVQFGTGRTCHAVYCATYDEPLCIFHYQKASHKSRKIMYNTLNGDLFSEID